jgi:hypothetical protein
MNGRGGATLADPLGSTRSHGRIRLRNIGIRLLARVAREGTPVEIISQHTRAPEPARNRRRATVCGMSESLPRDDGRRVRRLYPLPRFFAAMDSFYAREGHCLVPRTHIEAGYHLGASVARFRQRKRAGTLDRRRVAEIEQHYPRWVWDARAEHWQKQFLTAMDAFYAREGHARVPVRHIENGYRLGQATNNLRTRYHARRLHPERARELERRYQEWVWDDSADRWHLFLAAMDSYFARQGHAEVPRVHVENGYLLGAKVNNLRWAKKARRLNGERVHEIERRYPGWVWSKRALG